MGVRDVVGSGACSEKSGVEISWIQSINFMVLGMEPFLVQGSSWDDKESEAVGKASDGGGFASTEPCLRRAGRAAPSVPLTFLLWLSALQGFEGRTRARLDLCLGVLGILNRQEGVGLRSRAKPIL